MKPTRAAFIAHLRATYPAVRIQSAHRGLYVLASPPVAMEIATAAERLGLQTKFRNDEPDVEVSIFSFTRRTDADL